MRGYNDYLLLGLFHDVGPVGDAVEGLHRLGIRDDRIEVLSSFRYRPDLFGRPHPRRRVWLFAVLGAVSGFLIGIFLTVGTPVLYPLNVSGQPLIPVPPSIVILFEYTMLGALVFAFVRFMYDSRSPGTWDRIYDERLTEDAIGVLVGVDSPRAERAEAILRENGAENLHRLDEASIGHQFRRTLADLRSYGVWAFIVAGSLIGIGVLCVFAYGITQWIYPDQMVTQQSVGYEEGRRLAAPTAAVPIQGPVLIDGQPATEPLTGTVGARERGALLFRDYCQVCHGVEGRGNGPLSGFYSPPPADFLGPVVQSLPPSEIFRVITLGRGTMPSLAEGLNIGDRWDIITLIKSGKLGS